MMFRKLNHNHDWLMVSSQRDLIFVLCNYFLWFKTFPLLHRGSLRLRNTLSSTIYILCTALWFPWGWYLCHTAHIQNSATQFNNSYTFLSDQTFWKKSEIKFVKVLFTLLQDSFLYGTNWVCENCIETLPEIQVEVLRRGFQGPSGNSFPNVSRKPGYTTEEYVCVSYSFCGLWGKSLFWLTVWGDKSGESMAAGG